MRNSVFLLFLCAVFVGGSSLAAPSSNLLYNRAQLAITRKNLQQDPGIMPWQKQQQLEQSKVTFDIEQRDGQSLYNQKGWFNLSSYEERSGVLLAFTEPTQSPIVRSQQYAPVDILFIDAQGTITQIVPNILLSELQQNIVPQRPVLAFLFLKAGMCEKLVINPGDEVEFDIFSKPPTVLLAPAPLPQQKLAPPPVDAAPQPAQPAPEPFKAPLPRSHAPTAPMNERDKRLMENLYEGGR